MEYLAAGSSAGRGWGRCRSPLGSRTAAGFPGGKPWRRMGQGSVVGLRGRAVPLVTPRSSSLKRRNVHSWLDGGGGRGVGRVRGTGRERKVVFWVLLLRNLREMLGNAVLVLSLAGNC